MRKLLFFLLLLWLIIAFAVPVFAQEPAPDRVVFWSRLGMYTINDDGSDMTLFEFDPAKIDRLVDAVWSPDGSRLLMLLVHYDDGQTYLYQADSDGGNMRLLLDDPLPSNASPRWSPDGSRIIFRDSRGNEYPVYMMNADGGDVQLIIDSADTSEMPKWSPDGTRLTYIARFGISPGVVMRDLETGTSPRLIPDIRDGFYEWSPAGDYLAYRQWNGSEDIFTVNTQTGQIVRLLQEDDGPLTEEYGFDWSPDGSRIALYTTADGIYRIYAMNPDGSNVQQLTDGPQDASLLGYSPDGEWIAYHMEQNIWLMRPDGGDARQLTFFDEGHAFIDWSPNGDEIMLLYFGDAHRIRIIDIQTGDFRDLPAPPGDVRSPRWIP